MRNPLREIFDYKKEELPVVLLLFSFFFLVIAVFQIIKPLKNGLFIEHYGANVELYAKLANIAVAAVGVVFFSFLYSKLRRQRLVYCLCLFFIIAFVLLSQALKSEAHLPIWSLYLLGDLESTLMVVAFWAYATDVSNADQAKRLFGAVGAGGVIGGWIGSHFARTLLRAIGMQGLLFMSAGFMGLIMAVTFSADWLIRRSATFRKESQLNTAESRPFKTEFRVNDAIEGARLALSSRYLAAIVAILATYEIASQIMDYQFKLATEQLAGVTATQAFMADVYYYANVLAVVVQLFLVSLVMKKLGLVAALLVLPLAAIGSSVAFLMVPTLQVASLLVISDNGLNYSMQQTARETLYVPTTREEKYRARAFINMFVQRAAKGIGIFAVIGLSVLGLGLGFLSAITITVLTVMALCGVYAGRRFYRKIKESEERQAA